MNEPFSDKEREGLRTLFSDAFAERSFEQSSSFLARVAQRLYDDKEVGSYEYSKKEAGMNAVMAFLGKAYRCIDRGTKPRQLFSRFNISEQKAMLAELNMPDFTDDQLDNYKVTKHNVGKRSKWTSALLGTTMANVIFLGTLLRADRSGELHTEREAPVSQIGQADSYDEATIVRQGGNPDSEHIDDLSQSHKALIEAKHKLEEHLSNNQHSFSGLMLLVGAALVSATGISFAGTVRANMKVISSRLELEKLGLIEPVGANLNEQLIDSALNIEIHKLGQNLDTFMRNVVVSAQQQRREIE